MRPGEFTVVRAAGELTAADAELIGRSLDEPLETSVIVLVSGGGTVPAALTKKLKDVGAGERAPDSEETSDVLPGAAKAAHPPPPPHTGKVVTAHPRRGAGRGRPPLGDLRRRHG